MEQLSAWMGIVVGVFLAASISVEPAPVDINTDESAMANEISGLGTMRAEAIVRYRDQHGPFESVEELTNVPGLSNGVIDNNSGNLIASIPSKLSSQQP